MGTLLMANMVPEELDGLKQKVHPFFAPGRPSIPLSKDPNSNGGSSDISTSSHAQQDSHIDSGDGHSVDFDEHDSRKKRRKTDGDFEQVGNDKKKVRRARRKKTASLRGAVTEHYPPLDGKTVELEARASLDLASATATEVKTTSSGPPIPGGSILNTLPMVGKSGRDEEESTKIEATPKPKKLLKFNPKTGTIGSPPKPKVIQNEGPKVKGTSVSHDKPSRYLVSIPFGQDADSRAKIGKKIAEILDSPPTAQRLEPKARTPKKKRATAPKEGLVKSSPGKITHPFFQGKTKKATEEKGFGAPSSNAKSAPAKKTVFTSTPCSPKRQRPLVNAGTLPQFGVKSTGTKFPGAIRPAWPASGMAHIRGEPDAGRRSLTDIWTVPFSFRKSKGQATTVTHQESIIDRLSRNLHVNSIRNSSHSEFDDYEVPPVELRLPNKHFESGHRLQARMLPELRARSQLRGEGGNEESDDEPVIASTRKAHPAVAHLYNSLKTGLSAFDKSQCEEVCWAQKYAPSTAAEILQDGRDATLLKEWLQNLKVQSVDTGASITDHKSATGKAATVKRKRKRAKLDGFVISSDEEAGEMNELSDAEEDWSPAGFQGLGKKTVIRSGDAASKGFKDPGRLTNTALISGPHGCGKTAAVFAVAKELGFEIFEINASSRRNGKDVMEKVGDMTRNHLVQRHHEDQKAAEEDEPTEDEVARDIKSGKQGTMTSFFKPKPPVVPKTAPKQKKSTNQPSTTEKVLQPKAQKQSLILLEEVDILFEEDKQFWTTIIGLIAQSKRPFIMTCNDENLVPIQSLNLHGIFRFSLPPEDLALDVLLLVAANEGHALRRSAVQALYHSRSKDLRASLMELNYWCQLGFGDRRGGFDWFYPRWPKGCDKDEDGNVVRVVSEDTYLAGMGLFGRDTIASLEPLEAEEDIMSQCWKGLQLDLGDWHESLDTKSWTTAMVGENASASERVGALELYDQFSSTLSAADLCSCGGFGLGNQECLDATRPALPTKVRDDFIIGRQLIEATPTMAYQSTSLDISQWLISHTRELIRTVHEIRGWPRPTSMTCVQEAQAITMVNKSSTRSTSTPSMTRYDLSLAFDPIAISEKAASSLVISNHLEPSVFDRTTKMITLDVAPYVRGIVAYDDRLKRDRLQRSNLLSEGGRPGKRMRNTRSAFSALEGGARSTTRKENYFSANLNTHLVMRTAGAGWESAVEAEMEAAGQPASRGGSPVGDQASTPASSSEKMLAEGEMAGKTDGPAGFAREVRSLEREVEER